VSSAQESTSNRIHDRLADRYATTFDSSFTQYLKYHLLERLVRPDDVCLDVGVANGLFAIPITTRARSVHGVDLSAEMIRVCREMAAARSAHNLKLSRQSATALGYVDDAFDVVFSYSTLLLVSDADRAYAEIHRVLRPGGLAILDITGRWNLSQLYWRRYYRRQGHWGLQAYSYREICARFAALGFELLETHATGLLDQWKYVPVLRGVEAIDRLVHRTPTQPDLDYRVSQRALPLANRWYFVLRKQAA
jgi:ubiquinone/menaquinone biosynthesis C-methylase UbiE